MSRSTIGALVLGAGLGAGLGLGVLGCEKRPPDPEVPKVIVEEPEPTPSTPAPEHPATEPGEAESGEAESGQLESDAGTIETAISEVPCESDADCVKSACCHATSCVGLADAQDCSNTMCTLECRAGTMDCYGGCVCQAGLCAAQLWSPPSPPASQPG